MRPWQIYSGTNGSFSMHRQWRKRRHAGETVVVIMLVPGGFSDGPVTDSGGPVAGGKNQVYSFWSRVKGCAGIWHFQGRGDLKGTPWGSR